MNQWLVHWENSAGREIILREIREREIQIAELGRIEILAISPRDQILAEMGQRWHGEGRTTFTGGRSSIPLEISRDSDIVLPSGTLVRLTHKRVSFPEGFYYLGTTVLLIIPEGLGSEEETAASAATS